MMKPSSARPALPTCSFRTTVPSIPPKNVHPTWITFQNVSPHTRPRLNGLLAQNKRSSPSPTGAHVARATVAPFHVVRRALVDPSPPLPHPSPSPTLYSLHPHSTSPALQTACSPKTSPKPGSLTSQEHAEIPPPLCPFARYLL